MTISFNLFDLIIYLFALGAYCYIGFNLFAFGMLASMDTGIRPWTVIYWLITLGLWGTGLYYGTQSYF